MASNQIDFLYLFKTNQSDIRSSAERTVSICEFFFHRHSSCRRNCFQSVAVRNYVNCFISNPFSDSRIFDFKLHLVKMLHLILRTTIFFHSIKQRVQTYSFSGLRYCTIGGLWPRGQVIFAVSPSPATKVRANWPCRKSKADRCPSGVQPPTQRPRSARCRLSA